jgi:hypothetical protein
MRFHQCQRLVSFISQLTQVQHSKAPPLPNEKIQHDRQMPESVEVDNSHIEETFTRPITMAEALERAWEPIHQVRKPGISKLGLKGQRSACY